MTADSALPAETRIGHVHLKVANLERAISFYRDLLGFDLLMNLGSAAFLSAGGYHHHIGLNTWESAGGTPPPPGSTGLYHFAINFKGSYGRRCQPSRPELLDAEAVAEQLEHARNAT
jgi:catechol 2,3-dioxygenase